jgi:carbonic anhydrase
MTMRIRLRHAALGVPSRAVPEFFISFPPPKTHGAEPCAASSFFRMQVIYRLTPSLGGAAAQPHDARMALEWLAAGNSHFSLLLAPDEDPGSVPPTALVIEGDLGIGATLLGSEPHSRPFGVVLGCADERVPIELMFGRTLHELCVVRLAGNTVGSDGIGSIEHAIRHCPTVQVVVILGHTFCGAVAAAVNACVKPAHLLELTTSLSLRSLSDRIQVSVRAASRALQEQYGLEVTAAPGYEWALLDLAVVLNAAAAAHWVRAGLSPEAASRVSVVFGVYDDATYRVSAGSTPFAAPPADAEEFSAFAAALAGAYRIRRLLRRSDHLWADGADDAAHHDNAASVDAHPAG